MAGRPTRVLVAEDHPVYADRLAAAIGRVEDLELVALCRDGEEGLHQIRHERPDVAVLDLRTPRKVHECISLGAAGYLTKDADRAVIVDAIRTAAAGGTVLSPEAQASMAAGLHLSTATVKTHLRNLYDKLDVGDRAAAVAEGMRRGLIS